MRGTRRWALVAASVAGVLAAARLVAAQESVPSEYGDEDDGTVACYGINACHGTGDCAGTGHTCAGQNGCKGQGFIHVPEEACLRIEGGRLTAAPSASAP